LSHGHYTAFVRHPSGDWYHIDDTNVTLVGPAEVAAAEAYLLFYERRQDPRWKEQRRQVLIAC
jgi:ubiquitin C-terminal hydrolase